MENPSFPLEENRGNISQNSMMSNLNTTAYFSSWTEVDNYTRNWSYTIPVGLIILLMVIGTACGNIVVIIAVVKESRLQNLTSRLIASLAFCDLLVGIIVMPLSGIYLLSNKWPFGPMVCDVFIALDVIFCTSSILHLVAIAMDRYWTVTDITYQRSDMKQRVFLPASIVGAWFLSLSIVLPSYFGWKTPYIQDKCVISQNKVYTLYSTLLAFYIPMVIILLIYAKIFQVVRERAHKKSLKNRNIERTLKGNLNVTTSTVLANRALNSIPDTPTSLSTHLVCATNHALDVTHEETELVGEDNPTTSGSSEESREAESLPKPDRRNVLASLKRLKVVKPARSKSQKLAVKRERRALRTLLIITSIFIISWLPFFIFAIAVPFCGTKCQIPKVLVDISVWLGYANSGLNPILYTIFSPDFRTAFKKLLCCEK